eukprot:6901789-Pyramimonas_sp.AAC.1
MATKGPQSNNKENAHSSHTTYQHQHNHNQIRFTTPKPSTHQRRPQASNLPDNLQPQPKSGNKSGHTTCIDRGSRDITDSIPEAFHDDVHNNDRLDISPVEMGTRITVKTAITRTLAPQIPSFEKP